MTQKRYPSGPLKPALNPESVVESQPFIIFNNNKMQVVESQPSEGRAVHGCEVLNSHHRRVTGDDTAPYFYFNKQEKPNG